MQRLSSAKQLVEQKNWTWMFPLQQSFCPLLCQLRNEQLNGTRERSSLDKAPRFVSVLSRQPTGSSQKHSAWVLRASVYAPEFAEMFLFQSEHVQQSFESWCYCLVRKLAAVPRLFIYTRPPELWPNSHRSIEDFPLLETFIRYSFELLRRASRGEAGHFLMFEAIQDSRYCSFHNTLCISNKIFSYLSENVIVRIEFMLLVCFLLWTHQFLLSSLKFFFLMLLSKQNLTRI